MTKAPDPQKTTMVLKEVFTVEDGENKGALAINVVATRNNVDYQIPYIIAAKNVAQFDIETFMAKVRQDVDDRQGQAKQAQTVIEKLKGMVGTSTELD